MPNCLGPCGIVLQMLQNPVDLTIVPLYPATISMASAVSTMLQVFALPAALVLANPTVEDIQPMWKHLVDMTVPYITMCQVELGIRRWRKC